MSTPDAVATDVLPAPTPSRRRPLMLLAGTVFIAAGAAYGAWWWTDGRFSESTDNAYVAANVVQITPQDPGTVIAIAADDTDFVRAGTPLVSLEPSVARISVEQAEAALAQAVREVRTLFANNAALASTMNQREADLAKAKEDLARRQKLASAGAVSSEELEHARSAVRTLEAVVATGREQLQATTVLIDHTTVESHPTVARAAAQVESAYLALAHTRIPAPVDGYVARRSVQLGQRVAPGAPMMAVVPLDQVWVDANFKEVQLRDMRIGQPVALSADLYGKQMVYHGKVAGLGIGTGAAFALLPAQNATGNWIKVVQRVPVRITLDPQEVAANPLRVGLSMIADVDTHERGGLRLAAAPRPTPFAATQVYASQPVDTDARIRSIVAANNMDAVAAAASVEPMRVNAVAALVR